MGAMGAIEAFFLFQMKKLHCAEKPKPMAVFTMERPVRFGALVTDGPTDGPTDRQTNRPTE